MIRSDKKEFRYSIKFMFPITNNAAKYEALLMDLRLAEKIRVEKLTMYANSQLVVQQVFDEFELKAFLLKKYNGLVRQLWGNFEKNTIGLDSPRREH